MSMSHEDVSYSHSDDASQDREPVSYSTPGDDMDDITLRNEDHPDTAATTFNTTPGPSYTETNEPEDKNGGVPLTAKSLNGAKPMVAVSPPTIQALSEISGEISPPGTLARDEPATPQSVRTVRTEVSSTTVATDASFDGGLYKPADSPETRTSRDGEIVLESKGTTRSPGKGLHSSSLRALRKQMRSESIIQTLDKQHISEDVARALGDSFTPRPKRRTKNQKRIADDTTDSDYDDSQGSEDATSSGSDDEHQSSDTDSSRAREKRRMKGKGRIKGRPRQDTNVSTISMARVDSDNLLPQPGSLLTLLKKDEDAYRKTTSWKCHKDCVTRLLFCPCNNNIAASVSNDGTLALYNLSTLTPPTTYTLHSQGISDFAWSSDGSIIITSSPDCHVKVWRCNIEQLHIEPIRAYFLDARTTCVLVNPMNWNTVVVGDTSGRVHVLNTSVARSMVVPLYSGKEVDTGQRESSPAKRALQKASKVRKMITERVKGQFGSKKKDAISAIDLSADAHLLFTANSSGRITVHELRQDSYVMVNYLETQFHVSSIQYFAAKQCLLVSTAMSNIRLYAVPSLILLHIYFRPHMTAAIKSLRASFTSDAHVIVAGAEDCAVHMYAIDDSKPLCTLTGHEGPVSDAVVSRDFTRMISADYSGEVILWENVSSGRTVALESP